MRTWRALAICGAAAFAAAPPSAHADASSKSGGNASASLSTSASLDFVLNIGRFIFFRVGPRAYPTASTNPATFSVVMQPSIPSVPTTPTTTADSVSVPWNGAAPTFSPVPASTGIPVEVRTNAGQISIWANVVTPLTSGSNSIPLSQIQVTSNDAGLPAPAIPDTGSGSSVTVTGTAFNNLVTIRSANWAFSYNPAVIPPPGTYTGQISFTAVSP